MQGRLVKQQTQLKALQYGINVEKDNLWIITAQGPETSPFEGGKFQIELKLDSFPFQGPKVRFITKIYHPNISQDGTVCPQIIGIDDKWAPTKKLSEVLCKIKELMLVPNPSQATNPAAGKSYLNGQWRQIAKNMTQQYAK